MLSDRDAAATIPVKDVEVARRFYEEKLGFTPEKTDEPGVLTYKSGHSRVLVYESEYAGTNKGTAATWEVSDVDREVKTLKEKGVTFEHYDMPDMQRRGDVHVARDMKAAWFKDPDGNILAIVGS